MIAYELHTTPGQSGAPLYFLQEDLVRANRDSKALGAAQLGPVQDLTKMAVGVHTGERGSESYGTLITPAIEEWIKATLDEML